MRGVKTRTFWAPGRVNLIGEHTDLAGGPVLPAALDLGIRLEAAAGESIELSSRELSGQARLAANGSSDGEIEGWARYVAAVAAELEALGRPAVGIEGEISSTLPLGAGLSSSAALEVVVGLALCSVADFTLEPLELAQACRRAELRAVGVPCGILDQAASVLGRAGHACLLETGSLAYEHIPLPADLALMIVDSGVSRRLESSGYATRKDELERALAAAGEEAPLDPVLARRLRHVTSEGERVHETARLLRDPTAANFERLGEVFREGHESLRDDLEVTTPELDLLVEIAREQGALAARMTGGGFGGSIIALSWADEARRLAEATVDAYRARACGNQSGGVSKNAAERSRYFVCRASDGARELP